MTLPLTVRYQSQATYSMAWPQLESHWESG